MPAFFEIFMAMIGAMMSGASVLAQDSANNQNIALARETLNRQQKFSEESAEAAQQRQIDMYTQFFSPEAMTRQYKEAGLNPALIYAKGGVGGSSNAAPMATTPAATVPYINPLLGQGQMAEMMNVVKTLTEASKTKADTKKTEEETLNLQKVREQIDTEIQETQANILLLEKKANTEELTQENMRIQNRILEIQKDYDEQTLQTRVKMIDESYNILIAQEEKLWEEINGLSIDNKWKNKMYNLQERYINAQIDKLIADKALAEAEKVLKEWQAKEAEWLTSTQENRAAKLGFEKDEAEWNSKKAEQDYYATKHSADILEIKLKEYKKYGAKVMESQGWAQTLVNLIVALGYKLDKDSYSGGY